MKKYLLLILILYIALSVNAQSITNVEAQYADGKVTVTCRLETSTPSDLVLSYSGDDGVTYKPCLSVSGDLKAQKTGNKQIVWNCLDDNIMFGTFIFKVSIEGKVAEYKDTGGPSNAWLSLLVPGLGDHRVTYGKKSGLSTALWSYGLIATGVGLKFYSISEYKQYHAATEQSEIDTHYDAANISNQLFYLCVGAGAAIWIYDVIWVWNKGAQNKKAWQKSQLGFYYTPEFGASGLTYTFKF
ncbi:MAG: hypothetical protein FWG84_07280 [Bacteroidales bacterium]|nr:hypothetical protein [Bacteroidales bacterium]